MAVNGSKKVSRAEWIKWYESGAVAQSEFPFGPLEVWSIGEDPEAGYQTLCLGHREVYRSAGYSVYEPIICVVVPMTTRFELDQILYRLPANAIPMEIFFPEE